MLAGNKAMVIRDIATGLKRKATKPNINTMVLKNTNYWSICVI